MSMNDLPGRFCYVLILSLFSAFSWAESLPDFTKLAEENSPAVVNIGTTNKKQEKPQIPQYQIPDLPEDSPFNDFFRKFFGEDGHGFDDMEPRSSLGSGFIISNDGYIITNNHVIRDADEIIVRLRDRREFNAKLVGTDERSDISVIKIDAENLPLVKLGQSNTLKVGEWVLAIGSPFGFDYSVTAGIVSAKGRSLPSESYVPFIQTDVAINPGNSGGPLFNLRGEVVGVNSQIYSRTGGFMGLSFAIPVEVAMDVYTQLRNKGTVTHGWLGVLIQDVTRELAESFGMDRPRGALVAKVLPNSPASAVGIQPGDIITSFANQDIDLSTDLPPMVGNTKVGDKIPVKLLRKNQTITLEITIAQLPKEETLKMSSDENGSPMTDNRFKIAVRELTAEERSEHEVEKEGVLVELVKRGPASKYGIREGDIILQIDNQTISTVAQFKEIVEKLPVDKSIPLLIQRRGNPIFLAIKLTQEKQ